MDTLFIYEALGETGIVAKELVADNLSMVDFRNILVHHYVDIDPGKALVNISKAPAVFRQFAREIVDFMKEQEAS